MSTDPNRLDDLDLNRDLDAQVGDISTEDLERHLSGARPVTHPSDEHGRVSGQIRSISGADVFVDIGGKAEGILPLDEFEPEEPPQVGQTLSLVPQGFDRESGLMRLSLREARLQADLDSLKVHDVVKARVTGSNMGGLELRVHGLRCFMPMSQIDLNRVNEVAPYIGHWLECEVTEVDRRGKRIVLSRRRLLERQREEERQQLRFQLAEGQVRKGVVRRLTDFGAFVDLGGIEGLLHVSDMSYSRISHPREVLKEGDEIEVMVLKLDLVKDRISLGRKQLSPDPWSLSEGKYHPGDTVEGQVTRLVDFGAFVELEPGIEALIPISEMSWTQRVQHPKAVLKVGDHIRASVLQVQWDKRKISLSLKALATNPWLNVVERYQPDMVVSGAVTRLTDWGCFVQLEDGVEGLVHISELSNERVRSVSDVVEPGKVVQVRVLAVNPEQRRISLSMREPPPKQDEALADVPAAAPPTAKKKDRKKPLRGGLSW